MSEQNNNYTILAIVALVAVVGIFAMVLKTTANTGNSDSLTGAVIAGERIASNQVAPIAINPASNSQGVQYNTGMGAQIAGSQRGICYELVEVQYSNKLNAVGDDISEIGVIEAEVGCNPTAIPSCERGSTSNIEGQCRTGETRCLGGKWYCSTGACSELSGSAVN